jgi:hypothetical protein
MECECADVEEMSSAERDQAAKIARGTAPDE